MDTEVRGVAMAVLYLAILVGSFIIAMACILYVIWNEYF